jgi:hypothetical protein
MAGSHTLWSPSGAKRWRTCAGSVVAHDGVPDSTSIYAAEGTVYHAVAEHSFRTGEPCSAVVGQTKEADGFKFKITDEGADFAQMYVDRLRQRANAGCLVSIELKLDTSDVYGIPEQSGTGDGVVMDFVNEILELHDLKFGMGVKVYAWIDPNKGGVKPGWTPAPRWAGVNDQVGIYLASAWRRYAFVADWKFFKLCIHQPRIDHYDEIVLTREEMEAFAQAVYIDAQHSYGVWQAHREDARHLLAHLVPSQDACRWCAIAGSCKARYQKVANWFPRPEQLKYMAEYPVTAKNLPTLSLDEMSKALDVADEVETWVRAVRAEALARAENGAKIPGWKRTEGRKGDRTADPEAMTIKIRHVVQEHCPPDTAPLIPPVLMTEPELKSVAQIEKACKKLGKLGTLIWDAITGDPEKGIPSLITQAPGRPTLVRDFDSRPELAPQPVTFDLRPADQEFTQTPKGAEGLL